MQLGRDHIDLGEEFFFKIELRQTKKNIFEDCGIKITKGTLRV